VGDDLQKQTEIAEKTILMTKLFSVLFLPHGLIAALSRLGVVHLETEIEFNYSFSG